MLHGWLHALGKRSRGRWDTLTFASDLTKNRPKNAHIATYAALFRPIFRQIRSKIGRSAYAYSTP